MNRRIKKTNGPSQLLLS
uniref:Uncharacterized protein n=1 Tax=Rhizophora mucronata TaxID=61149 RepID=A0A2P2N2P4_RHIMU